MQTFVLKLIPRAHTDQVVEKEPIKALDIHAAAELKGMHIKPAPSSLHLKPTQHYLGENTEGYWFLEEGN